VLTATECLHLQLIPVGCSDQNHKAQTLKQQGCNIRSLFPAAVGNLVLLMVAQSYSLPSSSQSAAANVVMCKCVHHIVVSLDCLLWRICCYLLKTWFVCVVKQREGREVCFLCKCSFLEIYKEVITDLLNPAATRLHIREDLQQGVHVEGLLEETVTSGKQAKGHVAALNTSILQCMLQCWSLQQEVYDQRMMLHGCLPLSQVIQESLDVTACAWRLQHDAMRS